jgi:hypothetical protein
VTTTETPQIYADWLAARMDERGLSRRSMAKLLNPGNPDLARRELRRHLDGTYKPTATTRARYAAVLETGDDHGPDGKP